VMGHCHNLHIRAVSRLFLLGGGARAKPDSLRRASGVSPRKFWKARCSQRRFPPSQKLKDIPTKFTFWVNFVGKTLRSDKKAT
jgi:hypothetical protein